MATHESSLLIENDLIQVRKGIAVIFPQDLKPGLLGKLFHSGIKVVILKDPRISQIWDGFLGPQNNDLNNSPHRRMPWQENLFTIARNHVPNDNYLGDMFRFTPGMFGHIARKIKIFPVSDGGSIQAVPDYFLQQDGRKVSYPNHLFEIAWELMSNVLNSTLPRNSAPPLYAVKIDLIKYPDPNELNKIFSLLSDASLFGSWTQIGQKVDAYKGLAKGVFKGKILRDLFALSLLVPGINPLLRRLNSILSKNTHDPTSKDWLTIGGEHVDETKFLNGLASERDILKTQVYIGERWVDLPLTPDSLAIFPGQKRTKEFGFTPTWHRILLKKTTSRHREPKQNVTLSLSIVDR